MAQEILPCQRWARKDSPREYVWVMASTAFGVSYKYSQGTASMPEAMFRKLFEYAPKGK